MSDCKVQILQEGYYIPKDENCFTADCTVSLILCDGGPILVDTSGPWNSKKLTSLIEQAGFQLNEVQFVVGTHGHSDHIGNLNLFPDAKFIVGYDISKGNIYESFDFRKESAEYHISDDVKIIPTPGHMHNDVSVVVRSNMGIVVIAGDLFENENDRQNPSEWKSVSENIELQESSRQKVLAIADYIVPGHGKMFKVM